MLSTRRLTRNIEFIIYVTKPFPSGLGSYIAVTTKKRDISGLSRSDKLALYDALQEKKRRARLEKPPYNPNPGQLPVHESRALDRFVFTGNGGGKTTLAVQEAVWAAQGHNPITGEFYKVPARIIVVLDNPSKVEDLWLLEMRKWFDVTKWAFRKRGKNYINQIQMPNGSEIIFMFHLQEDLTFEGIEAQNLIVYDEPPPRRVFIALKRAGRTKGHRTRHLMIGTPISAAWLREQIYEPWSKGELPDVECFKYGTDVNKGNLAEGWIEEFSRHMTEKEKRIRLQGEFFDLEGLALAHLFDRNVHIIEPFDWPKNWPCVVSIDPAQAKPHVACLMGVDPNENYYYISEFSLRAPAPQFARELRNWYNAYPIKDIICDSLGNTAQTGGEGMKSFIEVLNDYGVRARATRYDDKDDERWIDLIQNALYVPKEGTNIPKLRIFKGNTGIISDIEHVQWMKFKNEDIYKPKLDISKKDFLATVKYAFSAHLSYQNARARIYSAEGAVNWRDRSTY